MRYEKIRLNRGACFAIGRGGLSGNLFEVGVERDLIVEPYLVGDLQHRFLIGIGIFQDVLCGLDAIRVDEGEKGLVKLFVDDLGEMVS